MSFPTFLLRRMASASVLQKLSQRARDAEEMIGQLKQQIELVKQTAGISVSKPEEARLVEENQRLRVEIEKLKVKLVLAEVKNGVKQVPLPVKKPKVEGKEEPSEAKDRVPAQEQTKDGKKPEGKKGADKGQNVEKKGSEQAQAKEKKGKVEKKLPEAAPEASIDISRLDMRVGKIVGVKKHPDADSLYVEDVDLGEGQTRTIVSGLVKHVPIEEVRILVKGDSNPNDKVAVPFKLKHLEADSLYVEDVDLGEGQTRTIVSGLVKHVPIEEMQDRLAVFMCNLKPAKMRGVMSQGMIMCASSPEKVEILLPPPGSQIGDRVFAKDYQGEPDAMLNPKKKIWETIKPDLVTNGDKVAAYKGSPLEIKGKGQVVAPTKANTQIS